MSFLKCYTPLRSFPRLIYKQFPSYWDVVTGKERFEALQHLKGNTDPFMMRPVPQEPGSGTKDCPIVVPSVFDHRFVRCVGCHEYTIITWRLEEGFPRRCFCNKWFILERIPFPKIYEDQPD